MKTKSLFVILVLILSLILTACGGSSAKISGSFAGKVDGSDAFISIVAYKNGGVTAYVCDSVNISEWFKGDLNGSTLDLTNASGAHLTADLRADSINGIFTPSGGSALNFTTSAVTQPAGLYRADETFDGVAYVGGWILLPDGDQRGAMSGRPPITVPPVKPNKPVGVVGVGTFNPGWVDPEIDP